MQGRLHSAAAECRSRLGSLGYGSDAPGMAGSAPDTAPLPHAQPGRSGLERPLQLVWGHQGVQTIPAGGDLALQRSSPTERTADTGASDPAKLN